MLTLARIVRWRAAVTRAGGAIAIIVMVVTAAVALLLPPSAEAEGPGAVGPLSLGGDARTRGFGRPSGSPGPPPVVTLGTEPWVAAAARSGATRDGPAERGAVTRCGAAPGFTGKVNLNQAGERELDLLPGIGPTKAKRIVAWRTQHGPFERLRDLRRVKGFGRKTVLKLTPYLTLDGPTTATSPAKR
ncbi:MAG TPA: helix-hairpin-helix domain-containing protein [Candidatus Acidoferrum sp.]|nr:helix-hairpin-helix domain-containing protein [Candidatus Acidoferrum sp.]